MSEVVPEGWQSTKLRSLVTLEYGKSPKDVKVDNGRIPIIGTSGIVGFADKSLYSSSSVILGRKGTINKPFFISEPFWAIDTTYFTKFGEHCDPLWFYLKISNENLEKYNEASGVPSLNRETLYSIETLLPPLPEQKKIASILTSVDEVIENTQKQIDKLQDLKKATMNELLTKGIGHTEFKDSELGRIPKSWEVKSIGRLLLKEYLLAMKDGNHGSQYPRSNEFQSTGIPFLAASSISESGSFNLNELPCLSFERASKLRIPNARGGDVVLTHNATVGRVSIIPNNYGDVIMSTSTTFYRVNPKKLNNLYLKCFFEGLPFQLQLQKIMGQTTRNQVPITAQRDLFVCIPPKLDEQIRISEKISSLETYLKNKLEKLSQTQSLKKSLMQDLLTGKKRVQVN
ncbi:restriction endonuclease subunit S [Opitutales bacterium]|nr:restriction endonuclease subunit S [Opitutales bacterium]